MSKEALWERLKWLNEGESIYYVAPNLDLPGETWFRGSGNTLRVFSVDTLHKGDVALPESLCLSRQVYYHKRHGLFVEFSEYASELFVSFVVNNGAYVRVRLETSELDQRAKYYQDLGFRRIGAWHISPSVVLAREYRDGQNKSVLILDGNSVLINGEETCCTTRETAETLTEKKAAEFLHDGCWLHLMESWKARYDNPPELCPTQLPTLREYGPPDSSKDAVDMAIAKLAEIHHVFPDAHLLVELVDLPGDQLRLEALGHGEFFTQMHAERLGRWCKPPEVEFKTSTSSFDYFTKRYGSITWIMSDSPNELGCFYCGNVSGGGWSPLEIRADEFDTSDLADAAGVAELVRLHVFHGGWHHGHSFAFDTHFTSTANEHPIIGFDECEPKLLQDEPDEIEPFGFWLLRRVDDLLEVAVPWLASVQG